METTRQQKIARLLQKDLALIFQQESNLRFSNSMVTVMKVSVTKDLSIARIYLSIFTTGNKADILKHILVHTKEIRNQLGIRVKHQLRIIPQLEFYIDDSLDYIENIDNLLKQ
jgi:ribosome-binding factor A